MKLAKSQANAKQHREAEFLLFENYSHFSPTISSKNNRKATNLKKVYVSDIKSFKQQQYIGI